MTFNDDIALEHLLFVDRTCRTCGKTKSLLEDFYLTRKDRGSNPSAYAYECKDCTIKRVLDSRREKLDKPDIPYNPVPRIKDVYPDWQITSGFPSEKMPFNK